MFVKYLACFCICNLIISLSLASEDFYVLLNVSRDATKAQIRRAFKKLAIEKHPDKNPVSTLLICFGIIIYK